MGMGQKGSARELGVHKTARFPKMRALVFAWRAKSS